MAQIVETQSQVREMLNSQRGIVMVSVPWSPWSQKSREFFLKLEQVSPDLDQYFDLWPERDGQVEQWYDRFCEAWAPQFELHGHGYGPFWWLAEGKVLDCLARPYEQSIEELKKRTEALFRSDTP